MNSVQGPLLFILLWMVQTSDHSAKGGPPSLIPWSSVKDDCPKSCGNYSSNKVYTGVDYNGTHSFRSQSIKDCHFGVCQANKSVSKDSPWYTDETVCPLMCRLYRKSEDTKVSCYSDTGCDKEVHLIYTPIGFNISACPAKDGPPSLVTWSTVKDDCPESCGNYSKKVYAGKGYNESHIFKTNIIKSCYFGACQANKSVSKDSPWYTDGTICPLMCRLYRKSEDTKVSCYSDTGCDKEVHLIYTPIGCNISACPAKDGPPSLVTWSTVKDDCPESCGKYSKKVYAGKGYNESHIFKTNIIKSCYFGACQANKSVSKDSPWYTDETICPLMCRLYRKSEDTKVSCYSDTGCDKEVHLIYTPIGCNISACPAKDGPPSLVTWSTVKDDCPESCGNYSKKVYAGKGYNESHIFKTNIIKSCYFGACQANKSVSKDSPWYTDETICPLMCRLYRKSEDTKVSCYSDTGCDKEVHLIYTPIGCNISACPAKDGPPSLVTWSTVKDDCPESCGNYSKKVYAGKGYNESHIFKRNIIKSCYFGACQANKSVSKDSPWYTDETICPLMCRLYRKSEDTKVSCYSDTGCDKEVHLIYTPIGCNISACPAKDGPPSLVTWSTVKDDCPESCGNYSKKVYAGKGYNESHIFKTNIIKSCYFGACQAKDGPPSLVTWSTVKDDCPESCGNYSKKVYAGKGYNESHIFKTNIIKSCYFGACQANNSVSTANPWYTDETICPLMCRLYRKSEDTKISSCNSENACFREMQLVYTPNGCNISACQGCLAFNHTDKTTGQSFTIKEALVGGTVYTRVTCRVEITKDIVLFGILKENKQPLGKIKCLEDKDRGAIWEDFSLNQKCNFSDLQDSPISSFLKNITNDQTRDVGEVLQVVVNITMDSNLTEVDLLYTATILEKTENVTSISTDVATDVLKIYKKVLQSESAVTAAQQRGNVANRILKTVDTLADKLTPDSTGYNRLVIDAVGLEVWDLKTPSLSELPTGLQLTKMNETLKTIYGSKGSDDAKAIIMLQTEMLQELLNDAGHKNVCLSLIAHKKTQMFSVIQGSHTDPQKYVLNSKVISAKVIADGEPITNLRGFNVTTFFLPNKKLPMEKRRDITVCAYWNFSGNDNSGTWSTDGCHYTALEDYDVCVCDHLTNFAALLAWDDVSEMHDTHTQALSVITITGLSLSVSGLSITVLTPIVFRKLRQTDSQRTLLNLALAELCAWIVFLAGSSQTQSHVGCIVAAALLHYFILASFMWMLAEAVLHYRLFVKVLWLYTYRYMLKIGIPAWGVPLLPVIAVLTIDPGLYGRDNKYCWLSLTAMYYAFALPVGLVILCNIIIYIMVVINIWCKRMHVTSNESERRRAQVNWKVSALSFVLFCLSWIFGFMAVAEAKVVFQYIFVITSSLQGFVIFLFFTTLNKHVRASWEGLCCPRKETLSQRRTLEGTPLSAKSSNPLKNQRQLDTSPL